MVRALFLVAFLISSTRPCQRWQIQTRVMDSLLMSTIDMTFHMEQQCEWPLDYFVEKRASLISREGYLQCKDTQWHNTCNNEWHTLVATWCCARVCPVIEGLDEVV